MKEEKILQVVNLSPSEAWVEKLHDVHPMKQLREWPSEHLESPDVHMGLNPKELHLLVRLYFSGCQYLPLFVNSSHNHK